MTLGISTRPELGPQGGGGSTIPTASPLNACRGVPVYRGPRIRTTLSRPLAAGLLRYDAHSAIGAGERSIVLGMAVSLGRFF